MLAGSQYLCSNRGNILDPCLYRHNSITQGREYTLLCIPTLIVFKDGKEVHRMSGALDEANLTQLVSQFI